MTYLVKFDKNPEKFLFSLEDKEFDRIINKLDEVKENPFRYLDHFEGKYYKLRIGDYRLLMDIDFEKKLLLVRVFDKRGRVYK